MDIHKEKIARREIGALASSKNITRTQKVVAPTQKERPQKFSRQRLDFSALDNIGHGTKVIESTRGIDDRYHGGMMDVSWAIPTFMWYAGQVKCAKITTSEQCLHFTPDSPCLPHIILAIA